MLVLTRKTNEEITIRVPGGPEITVLVVRVEPGRVRLGILAPRDVAIIRSEVIGNTDTVVFDCAQQAADTARQHGDPSDHE